MANYISTMRTNYFRVKDEAVFRDFMNHIQGCEDTVEVFERASEDGTRYFGFGCYGGIFGYVDDDDDDLDYDIAYEKFFKMLHDIVAEDDAIILMEVGNEKLRYVTGYATIITTNDSRTIDLTNDAIELAGKMLGDSGYRTQVDY